MRAAIALVLSVGLAGCLPPVNAETVEVAWQRCQDDGAIDYRINQCSAVIGFAGSAPDRRAAALITRGSLRTEQGNYARALADIGRAMRINGQSAEAFFQRGAIHQLRGAYDFAQRDFDLALALQPGMQAALDRRAQLDGQRMDAYRVQLEQLNEMLAQEPKDAALLNNRCWLRVTNNDDLDAALADCNASLTERPEDANVLDSRGLVHFKRGDYAAALVDYEAALAREPERGHYLYGRGLARLGLGQAAEGAADLARAEEVQPGVTALYESYGAMPPAALDAPALQPAD